MASNHITTQLLLSPLHVSFLGGIKPLWRNFPPAWKKFERCQNKFTSIHTLETYLLTDLQEQFHQNLSQNSKHYKKELLKEEEEEEDFH